MVVGRCCCLLFVARCLLFVVCILSLLVVGNFGAHCLLSDRCCLLVFGCWSLVV